MSLQALAATNGPGHPLDQTEIAPWLEDGKPLRLDHVLQDSYAGPWLRTLALVLARDRAGLEEFCRGMLKDDDPESVEAFFALVGQLPVIAKQAKAIMQACKCGEARLIAMADWLAREPRAGAGTQVAAE